MSEQKVLLGGERDLNCSPHRESESGIGDRNRRDREKQNAFTAKDAEDAKIEKKNLTTDEHG